MRTRTAITSSLVGAALALGGCGGSQASHSASSTSSSATQTTPSNHAVLPQTPSYAADPQDVYAADAASDLSRVVRHDRPLVYVPNSEGNTVDEIDPTTYKIVREFRVGSLPQHVIPAYDLRTLYVANDQGNSLTPINPANGIPGHPIPVQDPYNMYFTPDGRYAVVVEERMRQLAFRDANTMKLHHLLSVPTCSGVNHADYTADGRYMLLSCEFGSAMIVVDVARERVVKTLALRPQASPQDVKLAPDGSVFYVADLVYGGVWVISADNFRLLGFVKTGAGAHGLYPSRDGRFLYVSDRSEGAVSVLSFKTNKVVKTWPIPGGSPDMGNVSADGRVLWLSGRYDDQVYAIDTRTGKLLARVPVGAGPHGVCVWPQPGRYSLGHTGIMR
ncbi:MAG: YncE family protein [Solirubrobacterales bacterium]|nr:YncE family protein [Solirubrobacterales bacterium]